MPNGDRWEKYGTQERDEQESRWSKYGVREDGDPGGRQAAQSRWAKYAAPEPDVGPDLAQYRHEKPPSAEGGRRGAGLAERLLDPLFTSEEEKLARGEATGRMVEQSRRLAEATGFPMDDPPTRPTRAPDQPSPNLSALEEMHAAGVTAPEERQELTPFEFERTEGTPDLSALEEAHAKGVTAPDEKQDLVPFELARQEGSPDLSALEEAHATGVTPPDDKQQLTPFEFERTEGSPDLSALEEVYAEGVQAPDEPQRVLPDLPSVSYEGGTDDLVGAIEGALKRGTEQEVGELKERGDRRPRRLGDTTELRKPSPAAESQFRMEQGIEAQREELEEMSRDLDLVLPPGARTVARVARGFERAPLVGQYLLRPLRGLYQKHVRDGDVTAEEFLDTVEKRGLDLPAEVLGELGGYGLEIAATARGLGAAGEALPAGSRVGEALRQFNPRLPTTRGRAAMTGALEGLPSDIAAAIQHDSPAQVPLGMMLGAAGATAFRPRVRRAKADEATENVRPPSSSEARGPRTRPGARPSEPEPTTPRGEPEGGGRPQEGEQPPTTTPEERAQANFRRMVRNMRERGDEMPDADRLGRLYERLLERERQGAGGTVRQQTEARATVGEAEPRATAEEPEEIVAAAIRTPDGRVFKDTTHFFAVGRAKDAGAFGGEAPAIAGYDSGFVTSNGRFVSREEAYRVAESSGQPNVRPSRASREARDLEATDMSMTSRLEAGRGEVEPEPTTPRGEPETGTRPGFREETGERTRDLFGEERVEGPEQTSFAVEEPRTMGETGEDARATVSALRGKVRRGEASEAEVDRYTEALSFLRRNEGLDAEEVGLRSGERRAETEAPRDEQTRDVFEEVDRELPPSPFEEEPMGRRHGAGLTPDVRSRVSPESAIERDAINDYKDMSKDELMDRWESLIRGKARRDAKGDWVDMDRATVGRNTYGDPIPGQKTWGKWTAGGRTQSEVRLNVVERLLKQKGVNVDDLDRLQPFREVGRSDVMDEFNAPELGMMSNKDLVGIGGQRIRNMSDDELAEEIRRIMPVIERGPGRESVGLMERLQILSAEASREGRNIPDDVYGGADPRLLAGIARAGGGAAVGAAVDDENRVRGAAVGAAIGAGAPSAARGVAKALPDQAGQAFRRWFHHAGDLPEDAFFAKAQTDGRLRGAGVDVGYVLADFRRAVRSAYGSAEPPRAEVEKINGVLRGEASPETLPDEVADIVTKMRGDIDAYSRRLLDSGAVQGPVRETIDENLGVYLHRSYRIFDDPKWADNVPDDVKNRAISWLREEFPDRSEDQIHGLLDELLFRGELERPQGPVAWLANKNVGSKDLSILQRRKEIPEEIRALWGEYEDPRLNYSRSVMNMAQIIENHRFLSEVREQGLGRYFFTPEEGPIVRDGESYSVQIAAEGSRAMEPLDGLYTTPEIKRAFKETMSPETLGGFWRAYMKGLGAVKIGKTVYSPMTQVRNFTANIGFALANGHWRAWKMGGAFKTTARNLVKAAENDDAWRSYYRELNDLGVVGTAARAGELRDIIRDAWRSDLDTFAGSQMQRTAKKAMRAGPEMYQAGDDVWKIFAYENELARYRNALPDMPEDELKQIVARNVRNTYPTYTMVPEAIKLLRRSPVVGTFVSFYAEAIRNAKNTLGLAFKELADPNLRGVGAQRLAGATAMATGLSAITAGSRFMSGTDRRAEEDLRKFMPSWSENSDILMLGADDEGKVNYIDLSYTDPYAIMRTPIHAFMRGEDWQEGLVDAVQEAGEPFLSQEILTQAIGEVVFNKDMESGYPIYNEEAPPGQQTWDITKHIWDAFEPGFITQAERLADGLSDEEKIYGVARDPMKEMMAIGTGLRISTMNPRTALYYRARDYQGGLEGARDILYSVAARGGTVPDEELVNAYEEMENSRRRRFEEMSGRVKAIRRLGMTTDEVVTVLDGMGMAKDEVIGLVSGRYEPYVPSDRFLNSIAISAAKRSDSPQARDQILREFARRRRVIRKAAITRAMEAARSRSESEEVGEEDALRPTGTGGR